MGRSCCVIDCKTGYRSEKKKENYKTVTIYSFPKDKETCIAWLRAIPNKIKIDDIIRDENGIERLNKNYGVCAKHFPENAPFKQVNRHRIPQVPPSVFAENIPNSVFYSPPPLSKRPYNPNRNVLPDQIGQFQETYVFRFMTKETVKDKLKEKLECIGDIFEKDNKLYVFSEDRDGSVFKFFVLFTLICDKQQPDCVKEVEIEAYHKLHKIRFLKIGTKRICDFTKVDELIRHILLFNVREEGEDETDPKLTFLHRQVELHNAPKNSVNKLYNHYDLCTSFSWYAQSRCLYKNVRRHLYLPSESTLHRVTSIGKNTDDSVCYSSFFQAQESRGKSCILIVDEVHVKASIIYSGKIHVFF